MKSNVLAFQEIAQNTLRIEKVTRINNYFNIIILLSQLITIYKIYNSIEKSWNEIFKIRDKNS